MPQDDTHHLYEFFIKEGERLQKYLLKKSNRLHQMDAQDIVDEVMLQLLSLVGVGGSVKNLPAYVYRALQNRMIDMFRKNDRVTSLDMPLPEAGELSLIDRLVDPNTVTSQAEQNELASRIAQAIDLLEPKQRAIFLATEMDGKSFKDLSEKWQEPIGTLLSRKSRAMKALQAHLRDLDPRKID